MEPRGFSGSVSDGGRSLCPGGQNTPDSSCQFAMTPSIFRFLLKKGPMELVRLNLSYSQVIVGLEVVVVPRCRITLRLFVPILCSRHEMLADPGGKSLD